MARTAAILISRQPLRPSGRTLWVRQTVAAVRWAKTRGFTLCASTGMQTWDLVTAVASLEQVPLRLYLTTSQNEFPFAWNALYQQFGLRPEAVELVPLYSEQVGGPQEDLLMLRDQAIVGEADVLMPIQVRPDGHMYRLLERVRLEGKEVVTDFGLLHPTPTPSLAYRLTPDLLNPAVDDLGDRYLIHWTRTTNSAWPGERLLDYYLAIVNSEIYPRSALETLRRIVRTRRILASSRHMPGNTPTVALTALTPRETAPLMKWRARYTEMSFEPYGVGVLRNLAPDLGIREVRYIPGKQRSVIAQEDPWLWQSMGIRTDWRQEKEYRCRGDLDLSHVDVTALVLLCRFPEEATALQDEFGIRAVAMTVAVDQSKTAPKRKAGSR